MSSTENNSRGSKHHDSLPLRMEAVSTQVLHGESCGLKVLSNASLLLIRMGAAGVTPSPPLSMQNFSLLVVTITTAAIAIMATALVTLPYYQYYHD